jgi:hypothetical protein
MAVYGMQVYDANGIITLSTQDTVTRVIYTEIVDAGASGSVTLPDIDGKDTFHFALQVEENAWPHDVSRSGTTISWSPIDNGDISSGKSLIVVMLFS